MNEKLSKLIRKYVKLVEPKDLRQNGTVNRPDYVIQQKLKKMNWIERSKFVASMRKELKHYE